MFRETEALTRTNRLQKLLFLAFVIGAAWAGYQVGNEYLFPSIAQAPSRPAEAQKSLVGAEWGEVRLLGEEVPLNQWKSTFARLTRRLNETKARPLHLEQVFALHPVHLVQANTFDDFMVRAALPFPGSVFKLDGQWPRCIEFTWSEVPVKGARYSLEIAKTRSFLFYRSFGADTNRVRLSTKTGADYFWRVRTNMGRQTQVGEISSFLVIEPPITEEQKRIRALAARVVEKEASLADLRYCN